MSNTQFNRLSEVPLESLPILRDSYKVNWPTHIPAFNFLSKMIERFKSRPEQRDLIKIYSIDERIEEDATFIAISKNEIFIATLDLTFDRLKLGLKSLQIDSQKTFRCVQKIYRKTILDFIKESKLDKFCDFDATLVYMRNEDALELQYKVPDGLTIRQLSPPDVDKIYSFWSMKSAESEKFIAHHMDNNLSIGLYDEKTENLLAWCLEHDIGFLLSLQTDPEHLRKGYGAIVAKALSKEIARERGLDVFALIINDNFKSMNFFNKIGFAKVGEVSSIVVAKN